MYNWRKMTKKQQEEVLKLRKAHSLPWHGPPHRMSKATLYHISAANYEHKLIIGQSEERMAEFEEKLLKTLLNYTKQVFAWCILPNHYHLLIESTNILDTLKELGRIHGRSSWCWNQKDNSRGRKCWHRSTERAMRTERHKWATSNYIHHNPVHHQYVKKWQDWPFSSVARYLEEVGYDAAMERWKLYPLLDYGKGWDNPDL